MKEYFEFYYNLSIAYFIPDCSCMYMDKNRYDLLHPSLGEGKEVLVSLPDLERIYGPYLDVELREDGAHIELQDDSADVTAGSDEIRLPGGPVRMACPCRKVDGVLYLPVGSFMSKAFDKYAANSLDYPPFSPRDWNQPGFLTAVCDRYEYKEVPGEFIVKAVPREGFQFDRAAVFAMNRDLNGKHDGELYRSYWFEEAKKVMTYSLYVPTSYDPARPSKMTVALHGGGLGEQFIYSLSQNRVQFWSERFNYIFLAPNACVKDSTYGNYLDPGGPILSAVAPDFSCPENPYHMDQAEIDRRHLGELGVLKAIETVCAAYSIDREHIFLQGNSMGGLGAFYMGGRHPELFRAIAPFGIGINPETIGQYRLEGMPIRMVGGTEDHGFEKIKAAYKALKEGGYDVELDVVGGGVHTDAWVKVLEETYRFFERCS